MPDTSDTIPDLEMMELPTEPLTVKELRDLYNDARSVIGASEVAIWRCNHRGEPVDPDLWVAIGLAHARLNELCRRIVVRARHDHYRLIAGAFATSLAEQDPAMPSYPAICIVSGRVESAAEFVLSQPRYGDNTIYGPLKQQARALIAARVACDQPAFGGHGANEWQKAKAAARMKRPPHRDSTPTPRT